MSSHRYLYPDYKNVKKKRTQEKILGWLFIFVIIVSIVLGTYTYINATDVVGSIESKNKIDKQPSTHNSIKSRKDVNIMNSQRKLQKIDISNIH